LIWDPRCRNTIGLLSTETSGHQTIRHPRSRNWSVTPIPNVTLHLTPLPDGLIRNAETSAQTSRVDMTDALRDLEAFMIKAREMVHLAQDLNDRLSATATSATSSLPHSSSLSSEPEEATFIRSSLSQLGLEMANAPVTLDMIKDEKKWEEQLARELADVVQGGSSGKGILRGRGIIGLDEVWGGWNRARGICW
jgi:ESCRT-II complex subunit VPS36